MRLLVFFPVPLKKKRAETRRKSSLERVVWSLGRANNRISINELFNNWLPLAVMQSVFKSASAIVCLRFRSSLPFWTLSAVELFHCGSFGTRHLSTFSLRWEKFSRFSVPSKWKKELEINILFRSHSCGLHSDSQLRQRNRLNKTHVKKGDNGAIFNFVQFKYASLNIIRCICRGSVFLNLPNWAKIFFFFFKSVWWRLVFCSKPLISKRRLFEL